MTTTLEEFVALDDESNAQCAKNVARGAAFLDKVTPGWYKRIDLETLNLMEGSNCICGQAFKEMENPLLVEDNGYTWFLGSDLYTEARTWLFAAAPLEILDEWELETAELLGFDSIEPECPFQNGCEDPDECRCDHMGVTYSQLDNAWYDLIVLRLKEDANNA